MAVQRASVLIPRDEDTRPLIVPLGETDAVPFERVTHWIDVLADRSLLERHAQATLLKNLVYDLLDEDGVGATLWHRLKRAVTTLRGDQLKWTLYRIIRDADRPYTGVPGGVPQTAAGRGTMMHLLSESVDTGEPLPAGTDAEARRDLRAYANAMRKLNATVLAVEQFVVVDRYRIAGTMDRALELTLPGEDRPRRVVADLKTGGIRYINGKTAMQLAAYAQGRVYDPRDPQRVDHVDLDREVGLLIHLPQGAGTCDIYTLDLAAGQRGLDIAAAVHGWREVSGDVRPDDPFISATAEDDVDDLPLAA